MAKIKLKLDTRKNCKKKDGSYPLVLRLHHKSKTQSIGLKYSFLKEEWDDQNLIPLNMENAKHVRARIESYFMKARVFLNENKLDLEIWSMKELKSRLQAEVFSNRKTAIQTKSKFVTMKLESTSLTEFATLHINRLRLAHRNKTADSFKEAMARLKDFSGLTDISFAQVDITFLENFSAYCFSRRNKASTVHTYLRRIRKLFNSAIDSKLVSSEVYPFKTFTFPQLPKTKNRALRMEDVESIRKLELKPKSAVGFARNCFLFMFNNMGINFIELAKLKKHQLIKTKYDSHGSLTEGRIVFDRSKTGASFSIKLTEESIQILNQYEIGGKQDDDFVFQYKFEDTEQGIRRYRKQRDRLNGKLKELAELADIDEPLTTYYARHTWASIANKKKVQVTLISQALGHQDLKTTQIYLASFDNEELDNANDDVVL